MRLLYLADIRFPMERANGIQTIETCHALARRGVEVEPAVRRSDARSDEACLAFYGLAPVKNLRLRRVLLPGRLGFLAYALTLLLRSDRRDVVYTRDLVLADFALKIADATIVYEAHTVAAVFAEERAQMYEGRDPPSATKLRRLDARERRVWRKTSGTVAITAALLDALEKRHGEGTSSLVIADGCRSVDTIPPPITPVDGDTGAKVFYIGQLYPWKGIDVLIRAVLALFAVGDVYVSLCKKSAYAPFSARRKSRALF